MRGEAACAAGSKRVFWMSRKHLLGNFMWQRNKKRRGKRQRKKPLEKV